MSAAQAVTRAREALHQWPWIPAVEDEHQLPRWMLLAVGLRETGLRHIIGDGGHGHGPWQYDDRTPGRAAAIARIDRGDTQFAAEIAAGMLHDLFTRWRDWTKALNAYNSGQPKTEFTTGRNYGPNVLEALDLLQRSLGPLDHPAPLPAPGPVAPQPDPVPAPVVVFRGVLEGDPVSVVIVTIPTDGNGDGDAPAPPGFLAVSPAGAHDKYDHATSDADSLVVPVGARQSGGGFLLVVAGGPRNSTVGAPVLVAD